MKHIHIPMFYVSLKLIIHYEMQRIHMYILVNEDIHSNSSNKSNTFFSPHP